MYGVNTNLPADLRGTIRNAGHKSPFRKQLEIDMKIRRESNNTAKRIELNESMSRKLELTTIMEKI